MGDHRGIPKPVLARDHSSIQCLYVFKKDFPLLFCLFMPRLRKAHKYNAGIFLFCLFFLV